MDTDKIAEALLLADEAIARSSLREISTEEAEKIQGERVDGRRTYATDEINLFCLVRQNSRGADVHWLGEWILYKKSKPEIRRDLVLNYMRENKDIAQSQQMIMNALGITKNQAVHSINMLVFDNEIHAAKILMSGVGHGTVFYQIGSKQTSQTGIVIEGPWV